MLAVKNQHAAAVKDLVECACRKDVSVSLFAMMSKDTDELLMAAASNGLSVVIESNRHGEREPEKETEPERNSVTVAEWLLIEVEKELEDAERGDEKRKALVGKVNVKGRTALMEAALNGQKEVVKALLTRGADVDKVQNRGLDPAHVRRRQRPSPHRQTAPRVRRQQQEGQRHDRAEACEGPGARCGGQVPGSRLFGQGQQGRVADHSQRGARGTVEELLACARHVRPDGQPQA
eukprot:3938460-Rhodomonas_salina.2